MTKDTLSHKILLCVSGSIAAYKAAYLARLFIKAGCEVRVVMTESAKEFIGETTFQAITDYPVRSAVFDPEHEKTMDHISLARWSDITVIAPATANSIAQISSGRAENLLTTLVLASTSPTVIAPAMNPEMWKKNATQDNVKTLRSRGMQFINPASGDHACGELGEGRMEEPEKIAQFVLDYLESRKKIKAHLKGKKVLITAGPTEEAIDPVRVITNRSSGKMGYALAQVATEFGAEVTLITGPTSLPCPNVKECITIKSALEMHESVMKYVTGMDIFIGTAAVSDYRPKSPVDKKIKKTNQEHLTIELVKNPDIISDVAAIKNAPFTVGFAAETDNVLNYAKDKRKKKNIDIICANQVGNDQVFGSEFNQVTIIDDDGVFPLEQTSKLKTAHLIIQHISKKI